MTSRPKNRTLDALAQSRNVITAVMLRDMRTRFFDHGLGFLMVSLWPLAHMVVLLTIYTVAGRSAPYGDSVLVFFATGLVPALTAMYTSRHMAISLLLNRPMTSLPVVNFTDVMIARAILEIIASAITLAMILSLLIALGNDIKPDNLEDAVCAYLASMLLGIGMGSLVSVLVLVNHAFMTSYALLLIISYITSGILFNPQNLPDYLTGPLSWSPVFQCVEWMRVAFYPSYSDKLLDRQYVIEFAVCALFIGLLTERLLRRRLLED